MRALTDDEMLILMYVAGVFAAGFMFCYWFIG